MDSTLARRSARMRDASESGSLAGVGAGGSRWRGWLFTSRGLSNDVYG